MPLDLVDIEAALRLKNFSFQIPTPVKGSRTGIHRSLYRGASPDFLEYKEYSRGDELKQVDWRVYGRLDRLYVKKYEDEVNMSWFLLLDTSSSMAYGEEGETKIDFAKRLSATLTYLLLTQGDAVGVCGFCDENIDSVLPRSGVHFLGPIFEKLDSLAPSGGTLIKEPMLRAIENLKGDSVFVIVSDFLTDLESVAESFRLLKSSGKHIVVFHVLHPDEVEFDFDGRIEFEDMEEQTKVLVDAGDIREAYGNRLKEFRSSLKRICYESRSRYVFSPSDSSVGDALIEIAEI